MGNHTRVNKKPEDGDEFPAHESAREMRFARNRNRLQVEGSFCQRARYKEV